jgi:hypothetical protein
MFPQVTSFIHHSKLFSPGYDIVLFKQNIDFIFDNRLPKLELSRHSLFIKENVA